MMETIALIWIILVRTPEGSYPSAVYFTDVKTCREQAAKEQIRAGYSYHCFTLFPFKEHP